MSISDKNFYNLTISINKALNPMEAPLKIKHARSIIIITHHTKEAKSFWAVVTRQPIMENRFTAWKFCHLLHKVLREGHESTIRHSQPHKKMVLEMGKLWGHLQDGVGHCIQAYSKLITTKLEFHRKNEFFPGTLSTELREIERFTGEDINMYFQLCVEIYDYLDDIIDLQSKVFATINTFRMSSMTPQGQCRLAPLITLIQDSNPLYDLSVRLMFKLHNELPSDILIGHRDRFSDIFHKLKSFYNNVRPLQYFSDLIQVPLLPETAPNFSSKVDFGSYVPPVVVVPQEPEPNQMVDNLVDTKNISHDQNMSILKEDFSEKMLIYENSIKEKNEVIRHLQNELNELQQMMNSVQSSHEQNVNELKEEILTLNSELTDAREISTNMRVLKDELELKLQTTPTLLEKVNEEVGKVKASEEKFNKLKNMYSQIRDEHINLLRQHGESTRILHKLRSENTALIAANESLNNKLTDCEEIIKSKDIVVNQNSVLEKKLQESYDDYENLNKTCKKLQLEQESLHKSKLEEIALLSSDNQKLQTVTKDLDDYKVQIKNLEQSLAECNDGRYRELKEQEDIINNLKIEMDVRTNEHLLTKKTLENKIEANNLELKKIQENCCGLKIKIEDQDTVIERITREKVHLENEIQDLLQQNSSCEAKLSETCKQLQILGSTLNDTEMKYKSLFSSLKQTIIKTVESVSLNQIDGNILDNIENMSNSLEDLKNALNELDIVYKMHYADECVIEGFIRKVIVTGHHFSAMKDNCKLLYNKTTNFEKGEEIFSIINIMCDRLKGLFEYLCQCKTTDIVESEISAIKTYLDDLSKLGKDLFEIAGTSIDLENLVQNELSEMDRVIEEAAEKIVEILSSARNVNSGIKLEVNEKILDACTNLMECIKVLIQKSRVLQAEIISLGRGSASIKDFYKRNSQWSEGLISASKSVAKGANMLVEAANKAVSGESSRSLEIIVAAQEIAACTAQLVVASKVKAPRESQKLVDLTKASRNVSQATGAVVATVKDCNQQLEISQDVDITKLTSNQAKTMEMEIHLKVLELEQALQVERLRLSAFRRQNYQNTED